MKSQLPKVLHKVAGLPLLGHVILALRAAGVRRFRIELVRESAEDVARIVAAYTRLLAGQAAPAEVWRALKTEGGYGVVKGSLRVLQA